LTIDFFQGLKDTVAQAIREDLGEGDITAALIADDKHVTAKVITRQAGVVCGQPWVDEVFQQINPLLEVSWLVKDGATVSPDQILFSVTGKAQSILSGERPALNFLQTLSGTATATAKYASLIAHTSTTLLDTRKTLPGLRLAQKYAVTCGGGSNHRIGLFDAYLLKENHIEACGSIADAVALARKNQPKARVEVEVEDLDEFRVAVDAGPDWIMLDNFSLADMKTAAVSNSGIKLEASGGIESDEDLIAIAETGVDFISVGALTKHVRAMDLSMRFSEP
jgi:nicotinate-nucleotide pyrophosphorylase (carboxylating)